MIKKDLILISVCFPKNFLFSYLSMCLRKYLVLISCLSLFKLYLVHANILMNFSLYVTVKIVVIKKCINLVETFFSFFIACIVFFCFFCFTFDTKPFAFWNFFILHAFNEEALNFTSFTFTHNKVILVLTYFTYAPFVL